MKILVTGGAGFIGCNLVKNLIENKNEVIVFDDLRTGLKSNLYGLHAKLYAYDICKELPIINNLDAIVHLAAYTSVVDSTFNPRNTWTNNVDGVFNILEYCRMNNIKRFVFASSSAVEGDSIYGATKIVGETLCKSYCNNFGIETISLRFSNVYGLYSNNEGIIPKFINLIKENKSLVVYGDGKQTRDFVNVEDICQAISKSLYAKSGVYQIGTGISISVNGLVNLLKEISKKDIVVEYKPSRLAEIKDSVADITEARKVLGYNPRISLKQGLLKMWSSI